MRDPEDGIIWGVVVLWLLALLVNFAFWGALIWGIVKLVQHFTG